MAETIERQEAMEGRVSMTPEEPKAPFVEDRKRRVVIKKITVATAALAGCSLMPGKWTTPLVEFGVIPAHATTSSLVDVVIDAIEQINNEKNAENLQQVEPVETSVKTEQAAASVKSPQKEADWTKVTWGGNPNETSDDRDRTWWTKIHGSQSPDWHRKFPLPGWVDDARYSLEFEFSDGSTFFVSDSTRMQMDPDGPKYVPEESGESDPRKQHPKMGAARRATPTWVRFRKV